MATKPDLTKQMITNMKTGVGNEKQKVTSPEYRKNYDGIFRKKKKVITEDECGCYPGSLAPCPCEAADREREKKDHPMYCQKSVTGGLQPCDCGLEKKDDG